MNTSEKNHPMRVSKAITSIHFTDAIQASVKCVESWPWAKYERSTLIWPGEKSHVCATKRSYKPPWASPAEWLSCWAAGEDDCPSCEHLWCRSCPSPTCCSTPHPCWPNWWHKKQAFRRRKETSENVVLHSQVRGLWYDYYSCIVVVLGLYCLLLCFH